jgi:hypothetical protein
MSATLTLAAFTLGKVATNSSNLICVILPKVANESAAIVTVADIFAANFANVNCDLHTWKSL